MTLSRRGLIKAAAAAGALGALRLRPAGATAGPHPNEGSPLGTNLTGVFDWTAQWPFVDVFKISRPWISNRAGQPWGQGGPLDLTADGWVRSLEPGQRADTVMYSAPTGHPTGQYVCLYKGRGTLAFPGGRIVSQAPGRIVVDFQSRTGMIGLQILATDPADPIRAIRLVMPGFEATHQSRPFHPLFLERSARFRQLRFMDWQRTNQTTLVSWADRATPWQQTQASTRGVAVEYMVLLANTLRADPWFCMPHAASDDYVRGFATHVRDRLAPDLRVYLEYSNETWNGQFPQTAYVTQRGLALGLSTNPFQAGLRYHSQRLIEVLRIWREVFGGRGRVLGVLAAQGVNPWTGRQVMTWNDAYREADALAIAPYFGGRLGNADLVPGVRDWTADQVLDACLAEIRDGTTNRGTRWAIEQNRLETSRLGLPLVAYEGGQHLVGVGAAQNDAQLTALFTAVNRHPRIREVYLEYLRLWRQLGGGTFMQFSDVYQPGRYGAWGALEYQDQDPVEAPKYQALMEFIAAG